MDDSRIGRALRVLRWRRGMTQAQLAKSVGVSQSTISLVERGHLARLSIRTIRRLFGAVDAGFASHVIWRGGALDRILDARHARLVEILVRELQVRGWQTAVEVSFAIGREVGSIDVVAVDPVQAAAASFEVKSEIAAIEELGRRTDAKDRLLPELVSDRFGFRPSAVGRILVLPDQTAARDRVSAHPATFNALFPGRTVEVRRWLTAPRGRFAGIWFLRDSNRGARTRSVGRRSGPTSSSSRSTPPLS